MECSVLGHTTPNSAAYRESHGTRPDDVSVGHGSGPLPVAHPHLPVYKRDRLLRPIVARAGPVDLGGEDRVEPEAQELLAGGVRIATTLPHLDDHLLVVRACTAV